jgi:hypothetical protein
MKTAKQKPNAADAHPISKPSKDAHEQTERQTPRQRDQRKVGSKTEQVLALLSQKGGASIVDLTSATDWLPHTTRAALTGLRKRGHTIEAERKENGPTVYRLIARTAAKPRRRPSTAAAKA